MDSISENEEPYKELIEIKRLWLEEIARETEHYFQGEIQHDQRASWLLATSGILTAVIASLDIPTLQKGVESQVLLALVLISFALSGALAILTLFPIRGIRIWKDIFGKLYRRDLGLDIDNLIEERFRHGEDWSISSYEKRIKYHFRSHYLRSNYKAHGILWSSVFLLIGLVFFVIVLFFNFP